MTSFEDVLATPDDLQPRRAWAKEGSTREQRLMRYQLARRDDPEGWSLEAAEQEAELAYMLSHEAPFAGIEGALVKEYRDGVAHRVQLEYRGGATAGAEVFESTCWNTVRELELGLSLTDEAWRSPRLAQFESMQLVGADVPALVRGLDASGHLATARLAKVAVYGLEGEDVWPALLRIARLVELHTTHSKAVTPPPGAFAKLHTVGGDMRSLPQLWVNEPSVTRLVWGDAHWRFDAIRAPGAKLHHLTLTPQGGAWSGLFNGRVTWKDSANQVGGHDDDRSVVQFGVLDRLPAHIATVDVPQRLEVEWGARLLGAADQKKLAAHVRSLNEKRTTQLALRIAPLPRKTANAAAKKKGPA